MFKLILKIAKIPYMKINAINTLIFYNCQHFRGPAIKTLPHSLNSCFKPYIVFNSGYHTGLYTGIICYIDNFPPGSVTFQEMEEVTEQEW